MDVYTAMRFLRKSTVTVFALLLATVPATAHEFWLEPDDFTPSRGADIVVNHNYGQHFKGDGLPFVSEWHKRYFVFDGRRNRPITGFDGDLPAVTTRFLKPGLKILAFDGTPEMQNFEEWVQFENFLGEAGLSHIAERHLKQGKPKENITERFARKAKLLLGVGAEDGEARGRDRPLGLRLELVAGRNPYTLKAGAVLPVRLLFDGEPVGNATIHAFNKQDPENPAEVVTDERGNARIALPVAGPYMLSAIHIFEALPTENADWSSVWTSLTFAIE